MRIPDGDLAPARRRRYGGGYGRRRHRRNLRLGVGVGLLLVAGGVAYLLRQESSKVPDRLASTPTCAPRATPTTVASPASLPQPQQVQLALLNGTARNGLAKSIGDALAAQGFVVTAQANAPAALVGPSQVVWGPGAQPSAELVLRYVIGSRAVSNPRAPRGSVQVILGSEFHRLATPAELAAQAARGVPAAHATAAATASGCAS